MVAALNVNGAQVDVRCTQEPLLTKERVTEGQVPVELVASTSAGDTCIRQDVRCSKKL